MAYIIIDETKRITAASETHHCGEREIEIEIPEDVWAKGIHDYKYESGEFVYDPISKPDLPESEATADDVLNALLGVN